MDKIACQTDRISILPQVVSGTGPSEIGRRARPLEGAIKCCLGPLGTPYVLSLLLSSHIPLRFV